MSLPKKCLVDTNVPKTANLPTQPEPDSDVSDAMLDNYFLRRIPETRIK